MKVDTKTAAGERWLPALKDDRPQVRAMAARMVGRLLRDGRAVQSLAAAMDDKDPRVRKAAKYALNTQDPRAAHALVLALRHPNPEVRAVAADRTRWLAREKADFRDDIPLLVSVARDGDPKIRHSAIYVLGHIRDPRVTECLVDATKADDPKSRRYALDFLARTGDARLWELLMDALKDNDHRVRSQAAEGLGNTKDPRAVEPLLAALGDESWWVRSRAATALGKLGDLRAVPRLMAIFKDPAATVKDPNDAIRSSAAQALERLTSSSAAESPAAGGAGPQGPALLPPDIDARLTDCFAALMSDQNSSLFEAAARVLSKRRDPRCVPQVIAALEKGPTIWVRANAARVLGALKDPRAIEPLVACLADMGDAARGALREYEGQAVVETLLAAPGKDRPAMRSGVMSLLRHFGDARAVDWIIAGLQDTDPKVRRRAVQAAADFHDPRFVEPLVVATRDSEPYTRALAAVALLDVPGDRAAAAVAAVLKDDSSQARLRLVRVICAKIYRRTREGMTETTLANAVLHLLAEAMHDTDEKVRLPAIRGLGGLQDDRARELLLPLTRGPVGRIRQAAIFALHRLKGPPDWEELLEELNDPDPGVAGAAASRLARSDDPRAIPYLEQALTNQDFDMHAAVLKALEKLGRPPKDDGERAWLLFASGKWSEAAQLVPANLWAVISGLHGAPAAEWAVDNNFYYFFGGSLVCDAQGGEALRAGLSDPDGSIRELFVTALGRSKDPAAVPLLIPCLKDANAQVRASAATALGYIGDARAVPALAELLSNRPSQEVIYAAVPALGWFRDARVFPLLLTALRNKDGYMRTMAAVTLGDLGDARAVEPLKDALKDYHAGVVRAAREALGKLGHPATEPPADPVPAEESGRH